jgi:hypothetical protein
MNKKTLTAMMLFAVTLFYAQKSVVTSGGEASGSSGTSSYTIGQASYKDVVTQSVSSSEGIQQTYQISEITGKDTFWDSKLQLSVYPNPSADIVNIQSEALAEKLSYSLFSLAGNLLATGQLNDGITPINMKNYAAGPYLISIIRNEKPIKTFKILKN